jgi:hypothetical protein
MLSTWKIEIKKGFAGSSHALNTKKDAAFVSKVVLAKHADVFCRKNLLANDGDPSAWLSLYPTKPRDRGEQLSA